MPQTSFSINSTLFLNQLDSTVIQLIKVLSVEHKISIDDATKMAYTMIMDRIHTGLLNQETKDIIKQTYQDVISLVKSDPNNQTFKQIYNTFKLVRLDI